MAVAVAYRPSSPPVPALCSPTLQGGNQNQPQANNQQQPQQQQQPQNQQQQQQNQANQNQGLAGSVQDTVSKAAQQAAESVIKQGGSKEQANAAASRAAAAAVAAATKLQKENPNATPNDLVNTAQNAANPIVEAVAKNKDVIPAPKPGEQWLADCGPWEPEGPCTFAGMRPATSPFMGHPAMQGSPARGLPLHCARQAT